MIWLQENINQVINNLYYEPIEQWEIKNLVNSTKKKIQEDLPELIRRNKHRQEFEQYSDLINSLQEWDGSEILNRTWERPEIKVYSVKWETCIERTGRSAGDKFTLGFVDMSVSYSKNRFYIKGIPHGHARQNQLSDYALPWLEPLEEYYEVFFEVKTRIQSVGALLRQINFYKSYQPGKYVVVSPDDRHKDLLASQGVGFVKAFAQ
ncbi:hypothetical protein [Roseivirga thermotolerans]|uniref:hypothetical protein n=1 Tax=Roseivirga thermotolerans TaxID=1758176 RepID=UPI0027402404|nr:hypothetical protein [Roseivirga thermotolerans]